MGAINQYADIIIAALVVAALLVLAMFLWRAFKQRTRGRRGQRLGISEYQELDQSRRLVLVRRDNVEHLILIGGPTDVVVESAIGVNSQAYGSAADDNGGQPIPMRMAPRPPVFGDRRQPSLRTVERDGPALQVPRGRDPEES
ncbi:MAG: hypothetical protein ACREDX_00405 [Aestuariivirga sp.]